MRTPRLRARPGRRTAAAAAVVLVAVGGSGAWLLTHDDPSAAATTTTATVTSQTIQQTVSVTGTMAAAASADLDFAVSGTVRQVLVAEGDTVRKGQALAVVGDAALLAQRTAAVSSLTAAREQLAEDQDEGASATQVAADSAAVVSARSTLTQARAAVGEATLRSTIAGTVTSLGVAVGDVVGSGSGAASSPSGSTATGSTTSAAASTTASTTTAAVSVTSTDRFVLDATVSSGDVDQLSDGLQAQLTVTDVDGVVYGTVTDIGLVAQTSSSGGAVFPVTIEVTGTRDDLYAGTSATASVIVSQTAGVLTVSSQALQTDGDTTYVEKVVDGSPVRTTVEIGAAHGPTTEVVSGLAEGDVVQLPSFTAPAGTGGQGQQSQQGQQGGLRSGGQGGFPAGGTGGAPGQGAP